jgi:uncharacterized membrane protein
MTVRRAACALLLGMFVVAGVITLHLQAVGAPHLFLDAAILIFIPATATAAGLLWLLVRAMMPRPQSYLPAAIHTVTFTWFAAIAVFFGFAAAKVLGIAWPGLNLLFAVLGAVMIVMGNVAGKLPPNHAFGFRSPWALADVEIWDKTQRFGGWVMVIAGFAIVDAALFFDTAVVNWITLVMTCGPSILITFASSRFARQKRKARDEAWQRLA